VWKDFTFFDVEQNTVDLWSAGKDIRTSLQTGVEVLLGVGRSEDHTIIHEEDVVDVNQEKQNTKSDP
jgi:hypothetical protein